MTSLLQSTIILLLFVLVRAGDVAITAAQVRDLLRAVCYGLVALLALIALVIALIVR